MLQALIDEHVAHTQVLLGAWEKSSILKSVSYIQETHMRPLWNAQNPPLSRRDLFRLAARQGQVALARSIKQTNPSGIHTPGRDRRRIINAVEHLSASKAENDPILPGSTFATVSVSDSCTACGVCARACPTGTLHYLPDPEETTFQLTMSPQFCIGCELCAHICAANAIVVDHVPSFSQVFGSEDASLLREGDLAHCEKCKAGYAAVPETHLCPVCSFRHKNPFGSMIPPGIKIPHQGLSGGRQP
jgi:ferredoxin